MLLAAQAGTVKRAAMRVGPARPLAAKLDARGIVPSRLCIEITEGVFTDKEAVVTIAQFRRLGVRVAVDDFGVGQGQRRKITLRPSRHTSQRIS
jgi:EAL domain-containing protein (putative c-di-GMP-specific phosphodiesterase class I)